MLVNFGFKKVNSDEKTNLVKRVFNSVASKYDLMNDFMSLFLHRIWKESLMKEVIFRDGLKILDVATGSGDLPIKISKIAKRNDFNISVIATDINSEMLNVMKNRAINENHFKNTYIICTDGHFLPFADNSFDYCLIAFGIRNFVNPEAAIAEFYRILKKDGKLICMEFSKINHKKFREIYKFYSFNIIPKIGKFIANDEDSYRYLSESIEQFYNQSEFIEIIKKPGFKATSNKEILDGLVSVYTGYKL